MIQEPKDLEFTQNGGEVIVDGHVLARAPSSPHPA
jgi:hypothetical protein